MISPRMLARMVRKWRMIAAIGRKRISFARTTKHRNVESSTSPFVADRGHFVVYTTDWKRFEMPLSYLSNHIFLELFKMSEEEFGVSSDGPIVLPCDSVFMNHIVSLIRRGVTKDSQQAIINSVTTSRCSLSVALENHGQAGHQHLYLCGH